MALTLQQVRTLPAFADMSDSDIISHASSNGFDTSAMIPDASNEAGTFRSNVSIPLLKGVGDIGGSIGYGLEAAGLEKAGQYLQNSNAELQKTLTARQSQQAQADAQKTLIDDNGNYGGYNLGTLSQDVFGSLPGTVVMGVAGAPLAKVASLGSKALGLGSKLAEISSSGALGKGLAAGLKAATIDTTFGSAVGFGASEGIYSGASNAAQIQTQIRNTDINTLAEHPLFADVYHKETDPSLTPDERLKQTRDILATKAGDDVFANTAIQTGLISMATGGGVFGMLRGKALAKDGVKDGVLKTAAKGFALEGIGQEAPQSALEQRTNNQALKDYALPNQDINQGVLNAGLQGGIAGGVMGLMGGAGGSPQVAPPDDKKNQTDVNPDNNLDLRTDEQKAQDNASVINTDPVINQDQATQTGLQSTPNTADAVNPTADADPLTQPENLNGSQKSTSETSQNAQEKGLLSTDALEQSGATSLVDNAPHDPLISVIDRNTGTAFHVLQSDLDSNKERLTKHSIATGKRLETPILRNDIVDEQTYQQELADQQQRQDEQANQQTETQAQDQTSADQSTAVTAPLLNKRTNQPFTTQKLAEAAIASSSNPTVNQQDHIAVPVDGGFGIVPKPNTTQGNNDTTTETQSVLSNTPANATGVTASATNDVAGQANNATTQEVKQPGEMTDREYGQHKDKEHETRRLENLAKVDADLYTVRHKGEGYDELMAKETAKVAHTITPEHKFKHNLPSGYREYSSADQFVLSQLLKRKKNIESHNGKFRSSFVTDMSTQHSVIQKAINEGKTIPQNVLDSLPSNFPELKYPSVKESAKKPDWEMTRDEYKNSFDPRDYKDSNYDRMIHAAVFNEKLTQAEADKKLIRDYSGNKYHWAKTRKELDKEKKEAVKNAKAARAEGNKNPIHSVKWAQKSDSNTAKNNITSTNLHHNKLLEVHQERIQEALSEGKPVPQEVLADYPDLQTPVQETANTIHDTADVSKKGENVDAYHPAIKSLASDLTVGGGVGVVTNEHDVITGRTPSLNPEWFKDGAFITLDDKGNQTKDKSSVKDIQTAVDDHYAGKRLTPKQKRILSSLSNVAHELEQAGNNSHPENYDFEQTLLDNDLELQLNNGNISIEDVQAAPDEFDDSIPFNVKGDDLSIQQLDDFFGITNEERESEGSAGGDTQEALTGYTEAELATREREQAQREKQAAADELKARQKEEADKSIDGFADEMLGNTGTQDLFGGNPLTNLGRADKTKPTDSVEDENVLSKEKIISSYQHRSMGGVYNKVEMERTWHEKAVQALQDKLEPLARSEQQKELAKTLVDQFRKDYVTHRHNALRVGESVVSSAVAGGSNFNHKQSERRGNSLDKAEATFNTWLDSEQLNAEFKIQKIRTTEDRDEDNKKAETIRVNKLMQPIIRDLAMIGSIDEGLNKGMNRSSFALGAVRKIKNLHQANETEALSKVFKSINTWDENHKKPLFSSANSVWQYKPEDTEEATQGNFDVVKKELVKKAPVKKESVTNAKDESKSIIDGQNNFFEKVINGTVTSEEFKNSFNALLDDKEAITAELSSMTKDIILSKLRSSYYRSKSDSKEQLIHSLTNELYERYMLGESVSYFLGQSGNAYLDAIKASVGKVTDETLDDYTKGHKKAVADLFEARQSALAGMENPTTFSDYVRIINSKIKDDKLTQQEAIMSLPIEQREAFDKLWAEKTRTERNAKADQQKAQMNVAATTTDGQIVETNHTKTGEALFVVKAADRVEKDVYTLWNNTAKRLGGYYSSFRSAGAVPGFQFKSMDNAEAFLKFIGGDATDAKEMAQVRRDVFADDRSQSASERLLEMADKLEEKADDSLGQDRKENTPRRARQAAAIEARDQRDKAMASTMRNIAEAISNGTANLLDRVRQKTQVEMLQGFMSAAQNIKVNKLYVGQGDQSKHDREKPNSDTASYAEFPDYTIWRSNLADMGRKLIETEGFKKLGTQILKEADDVSKAYLAWAKDNILKVSTFTTGNGSKLASFGSKSDAEIAISRSGFKGQAIVIPFKRGDNRIILSPSEAIKRGLWEGDDKMITLHPSLGAELVEKIGKANRRKGNNITVAWQLENAYEKRKRLSAMGIETAAELRTAVREFIALRATTKEVSKIKEMERAMIGRANDGMDFFPTPAKIADEMIEAADIQPGMSVLEPSAGMGHIAERLREAGHEADVVEMSNSRKELLEAKGFTVVGSDFMDLKPRDFFMWGDTFKAPDGKVGIMRNTVHGGSGVRVTLIDNNGDQIGFYNRDDLVGVQKNGVDSGYDRIIMNPPFGDRRDAAHVQHAYDLLAPNGRLVAIMGEGVFFGKDKTATAFRDWLEQLGGTEEKLPNGSFTDPSLPVNTGVNARMVVIDKIKATGDVKFSKSTTPVVNPHSKTTLNQAVTKAMDTLFGQGWTNRLMATGKFKVISRDEAVQIAGSTAGNAKGFFNSDTDITYLVYDNMTKDMSDKAIQGLLLHEISTHALTLGKSSEVFKDILKKVESMYKNGNPNVAEGHRRALLAFGLNAAPSAGVAQGTRTDTIKNSDILTAKSFINKITDDVRTITSASISRGMFTNSGQHSSSVTLAGANSLSNFFNSSPVFFHANGEINIETFDHMLSLMVSSSHNNEVLKSVIRFAPIDVVDMLLGRKTPAQVLLHDKAMFVGRDSTNAINNSIPASIYASLNIALAMSKFSSTGLRAKSSLAVINGTGESIKDSSANLTGNITSGSNFRVSEASSAGSGAKLTIGENLNATFDTIINRHAVTPNSDGVLDGVGVDAPSSSTIITPELFWEEVLAYTIESHPRSSLAQRIVEWFRQAVRALGKTLPVLERAKFSQWANKLTEAELIGMATSALKSAPDSLQFDNVGRNREGIKFSNKDVKNSLIKNADPIREVPISREQWDKDFPGNKITTPIGEFKLGENQFNKINKDDRRSYMGLIKPTLENPTYIVKNKRGAIIFIKAFTKPDGGIKGFMSVSYNIDGLDIVISNHPKEILHLTKEINSGELIKEPRPVERGTTIPSTTQLSHAGGLDETISQQENNSSNNIKFSRSTPSNTPADNSAMRSFFAPAKGKQALGWLAGVFQRNHLIDFVAQDLPELVNYKLLSQEKDNFTNQRENKIGESYKEMLDKMDAKTMHELGRVQGMATRLATFSPATANENTLMTEEERAVYDAYYPMPKEAKEVYVKMRKDYQTDLTEKKNALIERIKAFPADKETQAEIIRTIEQHFDQFKEGDYFPLNRDGPVIVKATNADGELVVEHVATQADAYKLVKEMTAQGYDNTHIIGKDAYDRDLLAGNAANEMASLAHKTISDLKEKSVQGKLTESDFNDLFSEFNQLLINTLPDSSYRKHFIHRKGTLGESTDTLRAYSKTRVSAVKMIAALTYDHQIQDVLNNADKAIKEMDKVAGSDTLAIKSIVNELKLRESALKSTEINAVSQVLTSLGFMGALGFNIGSAAVNMLQVVGVALPELIGRHGEVEAMKEIASAYKLLFNPANLDKASGLDITKNPHLSAIEKQAMEYLVSIGKIDLTMTHDSIAAGKNPSYSSNPLTRAFGAAAKYSGYFFHVAEAANRQVTGMAAFNLAYQKNGGDFKAAIADALDVLDRTQFDYGQGNRARYMMSNTARVLTLFKAYALGMSYFIGRNAMLSIKGETPEVRLQAKKTLVASMVMSFATAGLFGMPIGIEAFAGIGGVAAFKYKGAKFAIPGAIGGMLIFQALLAGLGADDEDELETEFRNWLTDNFDQTTAEWVTKGPARLLPIGDIAGRTSSSELWWRSQNKQLEGTDQYNAIATALIGPIGSQIAGLFTAKKMYEDGQYSRMVESMSPAFLRNAIAANRMGTEGVTNLKGDKIIQRDLTPVELINKVIGFNPSVITNAYDANSAIAKESTKHTLAKSHLTNRWISGDAAERSDLMKGAIKDFNESVPPSERITLKSLFKSMRSRKGIDKHTQNGLYLSKKQNYLRDIGRFNHQE